MQTSKGRSAKTVTPFDWRRYTASAEIAPALRAPKAERPLSARERSERILAQRWGNPYCKPGMP